MKALVADDHTLFRRGLKLVLARLYPEAELHGAGDVQSALDIYSRHDRFDLVLLDLMMPGIHAMSDVRKFIERVQGCPVIVISAHSRAPDIMACIAAGARGYIPKSVSEDVLHHAIELVLAGETYLPSIVAEAVSRRSAEIVTSNINNFDADSPLRQLTERQRDVLNLLVEGNSNKEIGRQLSLLESTVKTHVKVIFRKLGAHNRAQAVLAATNFGWQVRNPAAN